MDRPKLAPGDTLLGQLQRGLGSGFLSAVDMPASDLRPVLEQCILDDPTWDHQLDHRGEYYARLMLAKKLPLGNLANQLKRNEETDESTIILETLGALAKRRHRRAIAILRGYVASGRDWKGALYWLKETGERSAWEGLDDVLARRFGDSADLYHDLGYPADDELPWSEWKKGNRPIAKAIRARKKDENAGAQTEMDLRALSTEELLDLAEGQRSPWAAGRIIGERGSPSDFDVLIAAVDASRPWAATAALSALARRPDMRAFEAAVRIIRGWNGKWTADWKRIGQPFALRIAASRYLTALPGEVMLPLARQWRSRREWKYRRTAYDVLLRHATTEDLPWVRHRLSGPITNGRIYFICNLASMIKQFPNTGTYKRLRWLYREFPYSFGRDHIVKAMAATDDSFASNLAVECLWDCESGVREVACAHVDLNAPGVKRRLRAMAEDSFEEETVRAAAQKRLSSSSPPG